MGNAFRIFYNQYVHIFNIKFIFFRLNLGYDIPKTHILGKMKYLITQLFILISSVGFLLYLLTLPYFHPLTGVNINWYNAVTVISLLFLATQSFVSLALFLTQKFLSYGWKEFPRNTFSLRWGIGVGVCLVVAIFLNIFNILPLVYGMPACTIILVILNLIIF